MGMHAFRRFIPVKIVDDSYLSVKLEKYFQLETCG